MAVGFLGLGSMGSGLAYNLQQHLKTSQNKALHVTNRTKDKPEVKRLLEAGATWVDTPADLAKCDIVFCSMGNDAALEAVFADYLSGKPSQGSIFIDASTVYPDLTEKLAKQAEQAGVTFLACPVFGRPDAALAGKTLVIASGAPEAKKKAMPYLKALGRGVFDVGDTPRQGAAMKLIGNFFIVSMVELIGEGLTLADKNEVDRDAVVHFLKESFKGPITEGYAVRTAANQFKITPEEPGFSATGGLKDASHIQNLARQSGAAVPVMDLIVDKFNELKSRADADALDWASIALITRDRSGVKDDQNLLCQP